MQLLLLGIKKVGDAVKQDEVLVEIETDKVMLEVTAPVDGVLTEILQPEGSTVTSSQLLGRVTEGAAASAPVAAPQAVAVAPSASAEPAASPSNAKMDEANVTKADVDGPGKNGRILKEDVAAATAKAAQHLLKPLLQLAAPAAPKAPAGTREETRVPMTRLRARIAERLLEAKQSTAMLTTFNEVNMKPLMDMRNEYKDAFEKKHNTRLGFMSLFVKASTIAYNVSLKSMLLLMVMILFIVATVMWVLRFLQIAA